MPPPGSKKGGKATKVTSAPAITEDSDTEPTSQVKISSAQEPLLGTDGNPNVTESSDQVSINLLLPDSPVNLQRSVINHDAVVIGPSVSLTPSSHHLLLLLVDYPYTCRLNIWQYEAEKERAERVKLTRITHKSRI